jgi:hypothetical protein
VQGHEVSDDGRTISGNDMVDDRRGIVGLDGTQRCASHRDLREDEVIRMAGGVTIGRDTVSAAPGRWQVARGVLAGRYGCERRSHVSVGSLLAYRALRAGCAGVS